MIELKTTSEGVKKNDDNTLSEISNYNLLTETAKQLFDNRKEVINFEYIEAVDCTKVTDSISRVVYFNNELFYHVLNNSERLYLVEDGSKLDLVGVNGDMILVCAPYATHSIECYL